MFSDQAQGLFGVELLHADQQAAAMSLAPRPAIDQIRQVAPATQIEVADTEISPLTHRQGIPQGRQQGLVDVVENSGHGAIPIPVP